METDYADIPVVFCVVLCIPIPPPCLPLSPVNLVKAGDIKCTWKQQLTNAPTGALPIKKRHYWYAAAEPTHILLFHSAHATSSQWTLPIATAVLLQLTQLESHVLHVFACFLHVFTCVSRPQVTRTNFALVAFMPKLLLAFKVKLREIWKSIKILSGTEIGW